MLNISQTPEKTSNDRKPRIFITFTSTGMRKYKFTLAIAKATLLAVACAGMVACHLPKPRFDTSFNPERKKT
jgi:hypothetical protein